VRKLAGWVVLACGVPIAAWPFLVVGDLIIVMQRFGGVPWSWDLISINGWLIERLAGALCVGVTLIATSFWLIRSRR